MGSIPKFRIGFRFWRGFCWVSQVEVCVSGPEKGVITKRVFSLEESLESLKSLNFLETPENGRILLSFPESGVL